MKSPRVIIAWISCCALLLSFSGQAAAANGTIRATFKSLGAGGVEQPLPYAYLYLRHGSEPPPLEQYFRSADYIFGPTDASGRISATVPEGTYYVRLTRRGVLGGTARPLGPPEKGDYTWTDYKQITVVANTVTDLGTKFAKPFAEPITITGVIKDKKTGMPLADRYVRAQSESCIEADYSSWDPAEWIDSNRCGPEKYAAQQKTDADGRFTLSLRDSGTYYIVESKTLGDLHQQYAGNRSTTGWSIGPITVQTGDHLVLNDMLVSAPY